jgi:hypothetical protein
MGHIDSFDGLSRQLPPLDAAGVNLACLGFGMAENRHDLVLAAPKFG